jgi:enoyl-CoA hydratase/carnithine racemase
MKDTFVTTLLLNRTKALNALDLPMIQHLYKALKVTSCVLQLNTVGM